MIIFSIDRKTKLPDKTRKVAIVSENNRIGHFLPKFTAQKTVGKITAIRILIHSRHGTRTAAQTNRRISIMRVKSHTAFT